MITLSDFKQPAPQLDTVGITTHVCSDASKVTLEREPGESDYGLCVRLFKSLPGEPMSSADLCEMLDIPFRSASQYMTRMRNADVIVFSHKVTQLGKQGGRPITYYVLAPK